MVKMELDGEVITKDEHETNGERRRRWLSAGRPASLLAVLTTPHPDSGNSGRSPGPKNLRRVVGRWQGRRESQK